MINVRNEQVKTLLQKLLNLFSAADYNSVIYQCKKCIKTYPEYVVLYNLLGSSYMNTANYDKAKEVFVKASKMDPSNISIMNNLANAEKNLYHFDAAENLFKKIIDKSPKYLNAYVNYGNLKKDLNKYNDSNDLYKKALKIDKKHPIVLYSLAMNLQSLGDFKLSITYAYKVLEIDPTFTKADLLISKSQKYKNNDPHLIKMKDKLQNLSLNIEQKYYLYFAISKAYEDLNDITNCYNNLKLANNLKKKVLNFDIKNEIKFFNNIKLNFSKIRGSDISKSYPHKQKIIFILGMPRSGTTLIEQIISSHSKVYGSGELPYLSKIIDNQFIENSELSIDKFSEIYSDVSTNNIIADKYFSYLKNYQISDNFITDKAPLNFRWIGFIKAYFPTAKIIYSSRLAKDNCLSLYKNLFEGNLNFSYDEKDLGKYYNLHLDLMEFWKDLLPDSFLEIKYESLIKDQESEIKKIIKYCGLTWEEQCLNFNKNKNPIKTVSVAQARGPIYKDSVEAYKKFSPYLEDLFDLV